MTRRDHSSLALFLIAAVTLFVDRARGDDWPQWRGPQRTGVAGGVRLPAIWPAALPAPRWRATVGEGYSGPVIQDGRVFIMGRDAEGLEACLAFDANTGQQLWRHAYAAPYKPPDLSAGRGPKSTPTVDRGQVYMLGLGGMFHCLDARTGQVLWKHDCQAEYWGVEKDPSGDDAWFPACGAAASALVDGELVILPVGGKKAGAFTAFDRRKGYIVWKSLVDRSGYGSPMLVDLAGKRQIVGFTGRRIVGLGAAEGELLWESPFVAEFEQTVLTPVIAGDLVIFGGEKKPAIALRIAAGANKLQASPAWTNRDLRPYLTTPVVIGSGLVGHDSRLGRLVCLNLATGETLWTSPKLADFVSLVVADGKILVLTGDGELHVVEANTRQYVELASYRVSQQGGTWAHLAVVGNQIYVKDRDQLLRYDF